MTESERGAPGSASEAAQIDWIAAERSPEFQELVRKRRSFVLPATIFFLGWYSAFVLLAGYAPAFMGTSIYQGFTVGYALALTQFLMVWVLGGVYLRRADRDFDPLARKAAERAIEVGAAPAGGDALGEDSPAAAARHDAPAQGGATPAAPEGPVTGSPDRPGAGDGGQAPPALRSSPTPGAGQSRPIEGEDR